MHIYEYILMGARLITSHRPTALGVPSIVKHLHVCGVPCLRYCMLHVACNIALTRALPCERLNLREIGSRMYLFAEGTGGTASDTDAVPHLLPKHCQG